MLLKIVDFLQMSVKISFKNLPFCFFIVTYWVSLIWVLIFRHSCYNRFTAFVFQTVFVLLFEVLQYS